MPTPPLPPILDDVPPSNQLHAYEQFVDAWWTGGSSEYTLIAMIGELGEAYNYRKKGMRAPGFGHDPNWKPKMLIELGDAFYYFTRACHDHGTTVEEVMLANERKLRKRHGGTPPTAEPAGT